LLAALKVSDYRARATRFTTRGPTPQEATIALDNSALLLHDLCATLLSVVFEFSPVARVRHRN
jgi:hypothetical protein